MEESTVIETKCEKSDKSLQAQFLSKLCMEKRLLSIFLVSGVRLEGYIHSFDDYVIYLDRPVPQIIYKRAVCSIMPKNRYEVGRGSPAGEDT